MLRLAAAACVAGLGTAAIATAAPARVACAAGDVTVGSDTYRVFCGPAQVTLQMGTDTLTFTGGKCARTSKYFTINVGSALIGSGGADPGRAYFGIAIGRFPGQTGGPTAGKDGSYPTTIGFNSTTMRYLILGAKVTLTDGRTRGTFSGGLERGGGTVSGSFTC